MAAGYGQKKLCGYNDCGNLPKKGFSRCHLHINSDTKQTADIDVIRARMEARKESIQNPSFVNPEHGYSIHFFSDRQMQSEILVEHTSIDKETADSVMSAVSSMPDFDSLEVPQLALDSITDGFPRFVSSLSRNGISPKRISVMSMQGLERTTLRGTPQEAPEAYHEVVVLDRGTPRESVVDPYIAIYAPVRSLSGNVNDQLPSGVTPFADIPWIGPINDYIDGPYMRWSNVSYQNKE